MDPLAAFWHFSNFFATAGMMGAIAACGAKLVWRRDLQRTRWLALSAYAVAGASVAAIAGLLLFARDGMMATYVAMVLACAFMLWWRGFGPASR